MFCEVFTIRYIYIYTHRSIYLFHFLLQEFKISRAGENDINAGRQGIDKIYSIGFCTIDQCFEIICVQMKINYISSYLLDMAIHV